MKQEIVSLQTNRRDEKGRFMKGYYYYPSTGFKKGHRLSPELEAKRIKRLREAVDKWTKDEIQILKICYPSTPMKEINRLLPDKTRYAISYKARSLGLKKTEDYRAKIAAIDVDLSPSKDLMYVLGVIRGDGCIIKSKGGNYYVVLNVTSEKFSRSFEEALKSIGLNPRTRLITKHGKGHWGKKPIFSTVAHSKRLYIWLKNLSLKEIEEMLTNREFIVSLIRGFYESEGSFKKNRGSMAISNSDNKFLELVSRMMRKIGVDSNVTGPYIWGTNRKPMYLIQVGKRKTIKFLNMVRPVIRNGGLIFG